jgi:hypothetical protein
MVAAVAAAGTTSIDLVFKALVVYGIAQSLLVFGWSATGA